MPRSTVHVWAPPQEGKQVNERLCTEPPGVDDVVVYHVHARPIGDGGWYCIGCGSSTKEHPDGTA